MALGDVLVATQAFDRATIVLHQSLMLVQELTITYEVASVLRHLGRVEVKRGPQLGRAHAAR